MSEQPVTTGIVEGEVVPTNYEVSVLRGVYDPDLDFAKLALEAKRGYIARGFRLLTHENDKFGKDALLNIPHVIVGVTYRPGFLNKETKIQGDYISCEAVVSDAPTFALPQVKAMIGNRNLEVFPNEPVVYNDGGTGIRRTLTKLFHETGIINVGGNFDKDGDAIFDRPFSMWKDGAEEAQTGIVADVDGEPFRYLALRGLRRSDYTNEYAPDGATTYYFG